MAKNLYTAVMQLESIKRQADPAAIRARAEAKAAQLFPPERLETILADVTAQLDGMAAEITGGRSNE